MNNIHLIKASKAKNDEFYTQLTDIEEELKYWKFKILRIDRYVVPKEKLVSGCVAINGKPCYARVLITKAA